MKAIFIGACLATSLALAGCNNPQAATDLATAKAVLAQAKSDLQVGVTTFCSNLPALQAAADNILAIVKTDAKTASSVSAGKAAAAVTCANPTPNNLVSLTATIAAAKTAVDGALKAAPTP